MRQPLRERSQAGVLQLLCDARRAALVVVGVGGDVVDQSVRREREREATYVGSKATGQRTGGDRGEHSPTDQPTEHLRVAMESWTALWMSEQYAVAFALEVEQKSIQAAHDSHEGRLHQQPLPATQTQSLKLVG